MAFVDCRSLVDADGNLKPVADLDDYIAAAVQDVETETLADGSRRIVAVRLFNKVGALGLVMEHLALADAEALECIQDQVHELLAGEVARNCQGEVRH
jgi:hypothetical protein